MKKQFLIPSLFFDYVEKFAFKENLKFDIEGLRFKFRRTDGKVDVYLREKLIAVYDLTPHGAFLFTVSQFNKSKN